VGVDWGLYDVARNDKGALQGRVSNLPDWPRWLLLALGVYAAALWLAGRGAAAWLAPLAALAAGCLAQQAQQLGLVSRGPLEWLWGIALLSLNSLVLIQAALLAGCSRGWRSRGRRWFDARAGIPLLIGGFAGAVVMLGLVVDARYRGFPWYALLFPAVFFLLRTPSIRSREGLLLAGVLAAGIPPQLWQEGLGNGQALAWALTCALLSAALLRGARRTPSAPAWLWSPS